MAKCPATHPEHGRCLLDVGHADRVHASTVVVDGTALFRTWPNEDFVDPAQEREDRKDQRSQARRTAEEAARASALDPKKHARRDDPGTSHDAAEKTRIKEAQMNALEEQYCTHDGLSRDEAEDLAGLRDTWRRTSDLHKAGRIERVLDENGNPVTRKLRSGRYGQIYRGVQRPTVAE